MEMSVLEAGMIICFGTSWPAAIIKTLKTKIVHGKSRLFLFLVLFGYALGILHKFFFSFDFVIFLYFFNFIMVLIELCLYFRYQKIPLTVSAASTSVEDHHQSICKST